MAMEGILVIGYIFVWAGVARGIQLQFKFRLPFFL